MTLPSFLRRTPEQIRDEKARQQILKDLHLRGAKQTPAEMRYARAHDVEKTIRANLKLIAKQDPAYNETKLQLAEVLADQGRFTEAAAAAKSDPELQAQYRKLHKAMVTDKNCKCVADSVTVQKQSARGTVTTQVEIPSDFVAGEVYSPTHGRIMPIVQCSLCGHQNITDAPPEADLSDVEK